MSLYDELNERIEQLRSEAERDWLTGVYNRGAVQRRINELIKSEHGALILIDVNEFNKINEKYGHLAGDRALQQLASILQCMVLKSDIIGRIGGDEFVIFIRGNRDDHFISERTGQIRTRVAAEEFPDIGSKNIYLSFGWAQSETGDDYESLFTRAEAALAANKVKKVPQGDDHLEHSIKVDSKKIRLALREPQTPKGAYYQDYNHFEILYRYVERILKRSDRRAFLLLLTLTEKDGTMPEYSNRSENMDMLSECIRFSLRISDVYTQYSSTQFLIMNTDADVCYSGQIAERVRRAFYAKAGSDSSELLLYESYPMGFDNQIN